MKTNHDSREHEHSNNIAAVCECCADKRLEKWQQDNKDLTISKGDFVKIAFYSEDRTRKEWMWVEINDVIDQRAFVGKLSNTPEVVEDIQYGDVIALHRYQICEYIKAE